MVALCRPSTPAALLEFALNTNTVCGTYSSSLSQSINVAWHMKKLLFGPHVKIPPCEKGRPELKVTVNSRAPWPRRGPQGIGEVYQCWWCLSSAVTEPDWQLLSGCSLSVVSSDRVPTPRTYRAAATWLHTGSLRYVCVWKESKYPTQNKLCKCWNY